MLYSDKDYSCFFETPMKRNQERVIVRLIFSLLNRNKYDSLDDFFKKNITYDEFLKKNNFTTVIKHFENNFSEKDYVDLCNNIRKYVSKKQSYNTENISTSNFGEKEYVSYGINGESINFVNSSNRSIEEQISDNLNNYYNTTDSKKNTDMHIKNLEQQKETIQFKNLYEIVLNNLSASEREMFDIAFEYQEYKNLPIKVDLSRGLLLEPGQPDKIIQIEKVGNELKLIADNDPSKASNNAEFEISLPQKKLILNNQNQVASTIYTDNGVA